MFFSPEYRLALVGDVLFADSIGRTDLPRSDHAALIRSIREQLWPPREDVRFIPGHGPTSTFGEERALLESLTPSNWCQQPSVIPSLTSVETRCALSMVYAT